MPTPAVTGHSPLKLVKLYDKDDEKALGDLLRACDKALTSCGKDREIKQQQINLLNVALNDTAIRAERAERSASAWYNSKTLWFVLGVGTAAYTVHLLR